MTDDEIAKHEKTVDEIIADGKSLRDDAIRCAERVLSDCCDPDDLAAASRLLKRLRHV